MTVNGVAAVDCLEALGLEERLAWPVVVKNEAALLWLLVFREQNWSNPLLSALHVQVPQWMFPYVVSCKPHSSSMRWKLLPL